MCIRDRYTSGQEVGADKVRRTVMGAFLVVAADITAVSYTHLNRAQVYQIWATSFSTAPSGNEQLSLRALEILIFRSEKELMPNIDVYKRQHTIPTLLPLQN